MKRIGAFINRQDTVAWVLLSPSLLALLVFLFVPVAASFVMSFFNINIFLQNISFAGLGNYAELMGDGRFWNCVWNTVYFTLMVVPLGTAFSLGVAVYVQRNTPFRRMLRTTYYIPVVCSMTAIGIVWAVLCDPTIGMFAYWSRLLGFKDIQFLKDPQLAMPLVALMTIWKTFGLNMIIFVAGIQAIPEYYYEAAEIDGANQFKQFVNITLPSLMPALGFCVITSTITSLMVFDQTYVMTRGGPLFRTETLAQYIYNRGFDISPYRLGYASSVAFMLFVLIIIITLVMYQFFMKQEAKGL
jgi:multiple sugar transport system permease protein